MCPKPERPYYKFSAGNTIEIYCGDLSNNNLELTNVTIEYIREPEKVELKLEQLNKQITIKRRKEQQLWQQNENCDLRHFSYM